MDDEQKTPGISVWNIVFMSGARHHWWDWLTPPDWRHACAFGYSTTTDTWVIYDVANTHSAICAVSDIWFDRWVAARRNRITAIVQIKTSDSPAIRVRIGLWCVTAIKHLVGIKSGALRPKALYRDLLKNGAKPAFEDFYGHQSKSPEGRSGNQSAPRAG